MKKEKPKTVITLENDLSVLLAVTENQSTSIRDISIEQEIRYGVGAHNTRK